MPALRSANWAGVIAPDSSASRPYCTPTLSSVRAHESGLRVTAELVDELLVAPHLMPVGLVTGSQTARPRDTAGLQLWVAVARLAKVASHDRQVS